MKKFFSTKIGSYLFYAAIMLLSHTIGYFEAAATIALVFLLGEMSFREFNTEIHRNHPEHGITTIEEEREDNKIVEPLGEWVELTKQKPPHETVLIACDTYDCGWVISVGWWDNKDECWMVGQNGTEVSHLPYTHWKFLPNPPKN